MIPSERMIWSIRASAAIILLISANLCLGLSNDGPAIEYENVIEDNGYHFKYSTSDLQREEKGSVIPGKTPSEGTLRVEGSYYFVAPDGILYGASYVADENGFRVIPPVVRPNTGYASPALIASLAGGGLGK